MRFETSRWTLGEVQERLGTLVGPAERSGTGRGTFGAVRDGSGDPLGGFKRVKGSSEIFETGRGTHREVRDGSGDLR